MFSRSVSESYHKSQFMRFLFYFLFLALIFFRL